MNLLQHLKFYIFASMDCMKLLHLISFIVCEFTFSNRNFYLVFQSQKSIEMLSHTFLGSCDGL